MFPLSQGDNTSAFRLVVEQDNYKLSLYWTRLQVGVKAKGGKQIWCSSNSLGLNFQNKILLGNFVDAWLSFCSMNALFVQSLDFVLGQVLVR